MDFGILAAGDGIRIKEEGSKVSKPLVPINGEPMIGRLIKIMTRVADLDTSLKRSDSSRNLEMREPVDGTISLILNNDMPEVWEYLQRFEPLQESGMKMITVKTPSSMHSFYELMKLMQPEDKFIVTTVDTIFHEDKFIDYVKKFMNLSEDVDGLMGVTTYIDDEKPLYVEVDDQNRIKGYHDSPIKGIKYISAGVYGLRRRVLPVLDACIQRGVSRMRNFQRNLVEEGFNIKAYDLGKVFDIDHIADIEKANKFLS